jgi:hypothetical protein
MTPEDVLGWKNDRNKCYSVFSRWTTLFSYMILIWDCLLPRIWVGMHRQFSNRATTERSNQTMWTLIRLLDVNPTLLSRKESPAALFIYHRGRRPIAAPRSSMFFILKRFGLWGSKADRPTGPHHRSASRLGLSWACGVSGLQKSSPYYHAYHASDEPPQAMMRITLDACSD